jgi:hypothetical protein
MLSIVCAGFAAPIKKPPHLRQIRRRHAGISARANDPAGINHSLTKFVDS